MGQVVAVCGPDGSGKSTIVDHLSAGLTLQAYPEVPERIAEFAAWLDDPTEQRLYEAQRAFLDDVAARQLRASDAGGVVERSLYDNFCVFIVAYGQHGLLPPELVGSLREYYVALCKTVPPPDVIVLLTAPFETLLQRCASRGRKDDLALDVDFLARTVLLYSEFRERVPFCTVITVESTGSVVETGQRVLDAIAYLDL